MRTRFSGQTFEIPRHPAQLEEGIVDNPLPRAGRVLPNMNQIPVGIWKLNQMIQSVPMEFGDSDQPFPRVSLMCKARHLGIVVGEVLLFLEKEECELRGV